MSDKSEAKALRGDQKVFAEAALEGNAEQMRKLLAKGVPVDVPDNIPGVFAPGWSNTALMSAAFKGHLEIVKMLLKAGASLSAADKGHQEDGGGGSQPLHYALAGKNAAIAELLLDAGADPNALGNYGRTPLVVAIDSDDVEAVRLLLKRGADANLKPPKKKYTPPLCAAVVAVKRDQIVTVQQGNATVAKKPEPSAPVKKVGAKNAAPQSGILRFLMAARSGSQPGAAKSGDGGMKRLQSVLRNPDIVRLLLEAGADPDATDELGQTALLRLAWQPNPPDEVLVPMMEALIKAGANVEHFADPGGTPLQGAALRNNPTAARLLAEAGANVNRIFKTGTALDIAARNIKFKKEELGNPRNDELMRELATDQLKRAEKLHEVLKGFGAKPISEAKNLKPPAKAAPTRTTAAPKPKPATHLGAANFLKFIYDGHAEWTLLAVQSPREKVTPALAKLWEAKNIAAEVPVKKAAKGNQELARLVPVVEVRDNPWTVIYRSQFYFSGECSEDVAKAAKTLSKELKTKAIWFLSEDTSSSLAYELFESGKAVETAEWMNGGGFETFKSTRRKQPDVEEVGHEFADEVFRELGIYLPVCYAQSKGKASWLTVEEVSAGVVEQADLMELKGA